MDYRGVGFGGAGNFEIVLVVVVIWLAVFVSIRVRRSATGKDANVGAITFGIVVNAVFGLFLAGAAFIPAWFVSSIVVVGYAAITGQVVADLVALHWGFLAVAFVVSIFSILWWLGTARS